MAKLRKLFTLNVAIFLISAAVGCGGVLLFLAYPVQDSGHLAAWVQAFGSIGALLVAILVSYWGANVAMRTQLAKEAREQEKLESGCKNVLEYLFDTLQVTYDNILDDKRQGVAHFWKVYLREHLAAAMTVVERLPLHSLGRRDRVILAFSAQTAARHFIGWMDRQIQDKETEQSLLALRENVQEGFVPQLAKFRELFNSTYV